MSAAASPERVVIRNARDVTDIVNAGMAGFRHPRALIVIALGGMFIDAYNFTSIGFGLDTIKAQFGIGTVLTGFVSASIMVGALIGALVGGVLTDRIGRYPVFMGDMLILVIMTLACGLAPNAWLLIVFRFLLGLGIGIDVPVSMALVAEYSHQKRKGGSVSSWQVVWYLATSLTYVILLIFFFLVPAGELWRWVVALGALPSLIVMLLRRRFLDESPSWAAGQGQLDRAAKIITERGGVEAVVAPDADYTATATNHLSVRGFKRLLHKPYSSRTIQASVLAACQSMEYYAVGFTLPIIIAGFFQQNVLTTILISLVVNAAFGISGAYIGVRLMPRLGSWKLATTGFIGTLVCMVVLGVIGTPHGMGLLVLASVVVALFIMFHAYGPGAQGGTQLTLSYPTSLRGIGSGFGNAVDRIGSMISLFLFPVLSGAFGNHVFFFVAIAPALGLIALFAIRWDPTAHDVDAEEFAAVEPAHDARRAA